MLRKGRTHMSVEREYNRQIPPQAESTVEIAVSRGWRGAIIPMVMYRGGQE